ncbi:hypothetical protein [Gemmata obscuriglobus]|uniref:Uncharacterized protein n=1 Tax=Gemmata obscuriglobus TaxID=114 RepID=A0A2Z3H2S1_9BACT|nr:hypothetical protein [Gemmata obscuriglobus]AWM37856.1 hypothetical protein C1280_13190 [Gemmata obscuriglobus]
MLYADCEKLDIGHAEELCFGPPDPIVVEGVASISEYNGVSRNELCRIDRRVLPQTSRTRPREVFDDEISTAF